MTNGPGRRQHRDAALAGSVASVIVDEQTGDGTGKNCRFCNIVSLGTPRNVLSDVRIEVHLSNGTELGPTAPVDLAGSQVLGINLPATEASFTGWIAHAEVGGSAEGSQTGGEGVGEHGAGRVAGGEHGARAVGAHDTSGERRGGG